jgi:hypothetical protein
MSMAHCEGAHAVARPSRDSHAVRLIRREGRLHLSATAMVGLMVGFNGEKHNNQTEREGIGVKVSDSIFISFSNSCSFSLVGYSNGRLARRPRNCVGAAAARAIGHPAARGAATGRAAATVRAREQPIRPTTAPPVGLHAM